MVATYRANRLYDAHREDPEFGYRFLVDEAGQPMADRTAWRICSGNGWWSAFGKKKRRGKGRKVVRVETAKCTDSRLLRRGVASVPATPSA